MVRSGLATLLTIVAMTSLSVVAGAPAGATVPGPTGSPGVTGTEIPADGLAAGLNLQPVMIPVQASGLPANAALYWILCEAGFSGFATGCATISGEDSSPAGSPAGDSDANGDFTGHFLADPSLSQFTAASIPCQQPGSCVAVLTVLNPASSQWDPSSPNIVFPFYYPLPVELPVGAIGIFGVTGISALGLAVISFRSWRRRQPEGSRGDLVNEAS